MANRIIGNTDITGSMSVGSTVISNSNRPILLVGEGIDTTKEIIFNIGGTSDAITHFGDDSPFVDIVKILIKNGVGNIKGMCVAASGESTPYATELLAYDGAYAKTMTVDNILCIIIDKSDSTFYTGLAGHLADAEDEDLFRYGVVGVPVATTTIAAVKTLAAGIDSSRIFIAFPNAVDDDGTTLDGIYTAAGLAAIIVTKTDDPALPVGGVTINGFGGVSTKLLNDEKDELADAGVTALYPDNSIPAIYRLVSTAQATDSVDSVWHDATTVFIADNVLSSVIAKLHTNYKRTKNVSTILNSIKTDVIGILEDKEGLEIIKNFDRATVSVVQDPDSIYGALVDYDFQVVTPLYTITITQHMQL